MTKSHTGEDTITLTVTEACIAAWLLLCIGWLVGYPI